MTRLYGDDAELYDIAFDWDVSEEVEWLLERLRRPRRVLEPGCGSGRMLAALAERGVEAVGLELSPEMIRLAEARLRGRARVVRADMTDFDLGETFDGAVCPVGTLGHLRPDAAARHLECLARHLRPSARYLVQLGVRTDDVLGGSVWDAERGETRLRVEWRVDEVDFERLRSRERSRIEILSGPRADEVVEEEHEMTVWTPENWAELVAASPFEQTAQYDGAQRARPEVPVGTPGHLTWHELAMSGV